MTNCEIIKYVVKKPCFFINFDFKIDVKTRFFEHIFDNFTISHELGLSQEFEACQSMLMRFSISEILIISSLLASGRRKIFIFSLQTVLGITTFNSHDNNYVTVRWGTWKRDEHMEAGWNSISRKR